MLLSCREFKSLGLDQENAHHWNEQVLALILIIYYHLLSWCKSEIRGVDVPSDFVWENTLGYQARKGLHSGTVKIDLHKFCHLK